MDDDRRIIPRSGGMFTNSSLAKADMATDLAIQLLADGGWSALTLRNVARAANVTPQAIAAWFPSVTEMRAAVAGRYGERWIRERHYQARAKIRAPVGSTEPVTPSQVALALLPATWLEEVYAGIWHTIVEASRWDEAVNARVTAIREAERDMVFDLLAQVECGDDAQREDFTDLVLAAVAGISAART